MIIAGEIWIEGEAPLFAAPVFKELEEDSINAVTDWLFSRFRTLVDVTYIKLKNPLLQSAFETSSEALKIVALESGPSSDAYKTALAKEISDFGALARFSS
jgi:hypothetical protein